MYVREIRQKSPPTNPMYSAAESSSGDSPSLTPILSSILFFSSCCPEHPLVFFVNKKKHAAFKMTLQQFDAVGSPGGRC